MNLIDEHSFFAAGGRGGDGVVHWHREKFKPKGGPDGGDGGDGGNFYIEGIRDITALKRIMRQHTFKADDGNPGEGNSRHGANGKDYVLKIPLGSLITNIDNNQKVELLEDGERILLLRGGKGGNGNERFKSSTNQTPMHATKGKEGCSGNFHVELKLIADVGLIGLPNAGKTSILNALTESKARIADYPFTTLDPNLGVLYQYIIADIPGLIEGAASGKGLGYKFLRHITRTNVIIHCISLERENILDDYRVVRSEIESYSDLKNKDEYIVLTKSDTVQKDILQEKINTLKTEIGKEVFSVVSVLDDESVKRLKDKLTKLLSKKDE